jgi:F-type H+-transporting ATPase subunit epsilon
MSALPTKLTLEVVTPEHELVHEEVDEVQLPAQRGCLGILPGHAPLLTELGVGEMRFRQGADTFYLCIINGYAEVLPDRVIVMAEVGERAADIDPDRARDALKRAQERLARAGQGVDWERASLALERAQARMQVADHGGSAADHE